MGITHYPPIDIGTATLPVWSHPKFEEPYASARKTVADSFRKLRKENKPFAAFIYKRRKEAMSNLCTEIWSHKS